jgi:hypothetical protein
LSLKELLVGILDPFLAFCCQKEGDAAAGTMSGNTCRTTPASPGSYLPLVLLQEAKPNFSLSHCNIWVSHSRLTCALSNPKCYEIEKTGNNTSLGNMVLSL